MCNKKDKFNMGMAKQASTGSEDPSTKVGAYIVDKNNRPKSLGYNGFIQKSDDNKMSYTDRTQKLLKIIHAEMNAILFSNDDLDDCILYCTHAPCNDCLKHVMQKRIKKVIYEGVGPYNRMPLDNLLAIADLSLSLEGFEAVNINGTPLHKDIEEIYERRIKEMDSQGN